jgi:hypothetical protein
MQIVTASGLNKTALSIVSSNVSKEDLDQELLIIEEHTKEEKRLKIYYYIVIVTAKGLHPTRCMLSLVV